MDGWRRTPRLPTVSDCPDEPHIVAGAADPVPGVPRDSGPLRGRWQAIRRTARRIGPLVSSTDVRRSAALRLMRPANLFQPYNDTWTDRYPLQFSFLRQALEGVSTPRLLSFGCSTGAEVFTLLHYLPGASVKGLDISGRNIADARRRQRAISIPGAEFERAGSTEREASGQFDAIACMAVFRTGALSESDAATCAPHITFASFDRTVADIARCLRPGGYLVIDHSNFRFRDCSTSARFECVLSRPWTEHDKRTPAFGRDDRRLPDSFDDIETVFRMR